MYRLTICLEELGEQDDECVLQTTCTSEDGRLISDVLALTKELADHHLSTVVRD